MDGQIQIRSNVHDMQSERPFTNITRDELNAIVEYIVKENRRTTNGKTSPGMARENKGISARTG